MYRQFYLKTSSTMSDETMNKRRDIKKIGYIFHFYYLKLFKRCIHVKLIYKKTVFSKPKRSLLL